MSRPRSLFPTLFLVMCSAVSAHPKAEPCTLNHTAPPASSWHWAPDTEVKVYFVQNMFTAAQQESLLEVMGVWNTVARETGTGVKFTYAGEADKLKGCEGCLTITRGEIHKYDRHHYAFFYPAKLSPTGLLVSAWICFDFKTTEPQAIKGYMAHELGHGMGLWDCPSCEKHKTIMSSFPGINRDNGLLAPSVCDQQVVKQVFDEQRKLSVTQETSSPTTLYASPGKQE